MDAEQRSYSEVLRALCEGREGVSTLYPPELGAVQLAADALALLRALPEWDADGDCVFSQCVGAGAQQWEHHETCPRHQITALLTWAGRA
jgi:hypothetical protein